MNQIKLDSTLEDKYNDLIFPFLEDQYDKSKEERIKELAINFGENKDYKGLCALLHCVIDSILIEDYVKKDCANYGVYKSYLFFIRYLDTFIELPDCYYKNELNYADDGDVYFNYYVALRTLIDHNLICYNDNKNSKINSFVTNINCTFLAKKPLKLDYFSSFMKEKLAFMDEHLPSNNVRETYKKLVSLYIKTINQVDDYDKEMFNKLAALRQGIEVYDESLVYSIIGDFIHEENIVGIIFSLFEFIPFINKYSTRGQKYLLEIQRKYMSDYTTSYYFDSYDILKANTDCDRETKDFDTKTCFHIYRLVLTDIFNKIIIDQENEYKAIFEYKNEIIEFVSNLLKVNKFYTDILGKKLDSFFISYFVNFFQAEVEMLIFGEEYAAIEFNPVLYLITQIAYFNNITSMDYPKQFMPDILNTTDEFFKKTSLNDIRKVSQYEFEAGKTYQLMLDEILRTYFEIYGNRINPMEKQGVVC